MKIYLLEVMLGVGVVTATVLPAATAAEWTARPDAVQPDTLQRMIADVQATAPGKFLRAPEFLRRLAAEQQAPALQVLAREIARAHPVVHAQPILFVVRPQYKMDHHNTETLFHAGEPNVNGYRPGGQLKVFHPATGRVTTVFDAGPEGSLRDPEVHFDGRRIIFAMRRNAKENYSIYELAVDPQADYALVPGSLRRLTNEPDASDIDPLYLPDGRILFSSTREPKYCHCNMHIMANLHRMDGDGANIHQLSKNTLFDGHPTLLPDGRVLYYRWEYVDRNFGDAQGLWTTNPDGTSHALYWGNNVPSPDAIFDARVIPGTDRVVCIFGACHDRPWGALAILNRGGGLDVPAAIERLWPEFARKLLSFGNEFVIDRWRGLNVRYEDPYPLVDPATGRGGNYFLVARTVGALPDNMVPLGWQGQSQALDEAGMGIYLVDVWGNEILLHYEAPGCFDPQPLAPRPRPPVIPDRRDFVSPTGTMYVGDVYTGTHMQGVARGEVTALRVVESREKRFHTGPIWHTGQFVMPDGRSGGTFNRPAISWAGFEVKQILGTVPVEPDGSAYFELPAERFVYFQLLDRAGQVVQTMRSGTLVQPGERAGCIGCHEPRLHSWNPPRSLQALARPPSRLDGPDRPFNYLAEIQPIWDKHCVSCHDFHQPAGKKLVLARDKELVFNASYVELFQNWGRSNALVNTVGLGLAPLLPPRAVGSSPSRLVNLLRAGHHDVKLPADELARIITWLDIGGPYYPDYASAHPNHPAGRSPLTQPQLNELGELTGREITRGNKGHLGFDAHRVWVSFDRPELSPCLQHLDKNSDAYRQALAIIRAGQEELRRNPEADQPGFVAHHEHQLREEKYQRLRDREAARRAALREGRQVYDPGIGPATVAAGQ
jgi:hypothetical protein